MKYFILSFFLFVGRVSYANDDDNQYGNIDSLKAELNASNNDSIKIELLTKLGWSYAFIHQDTAINYSKYGIELSRKRHDELSEVEFQKIICLSYSLAGDFIKSIYYGFENINLAKKIPDRNFLVVAYSGLSVSYREQEDYAAALKVLNTAKNLLDLPEIDAGTKANLLGMISSNYERDNQLDSALYYGEKALSYSKRWSGLYLVIGTIYSKLNKPDSAFYYYKIGIRLAKEGRVYIDLVDTYNEMSKLYEKSGQRDSAIYYAQKSIQQEGVNSYLEGKLRTTTQLAKLYESLGIRDSTIKYLKLSGELKNSLLNRGKTREAQSIAFNKQLTEQEIAARIQQQQNRTRQLAFAFLLGVFAFIGYFLYRNNLQKQKANELLQKQKEEIDEKSHQLEKSLAALKSTQAQLIQSEKLASLGELTAGIAHEIQNPMNFVNNFAKFNIGIADELEAEINKPHIDREYIAELLTDLKGNQEKINFHGNRASSIVSGMLEHSRTNAGVKGLTDINKLCDEYFRLAFHGLRAKDKNFNCDMVTHFDPTNPEIEIVSQDVGRVVLNLINNAFYAVNEHKNNPKNLAGFDGYKPTVTVTTQKTANAIEIRVKDNGTGIPENLKQKIFQPFFTTKPTGSGTGLGLSLAYDIITKGHGGSLKVESVEGEGSEFVILLPI